jgi:hypothetical protein
MQSLLIPTFAPPSDAADGCVRCFQLPSHTQRWATTVPAAGGILTLALAHQQKQQQQQEQQQQQQEEGNSPRPAAASPHSSSSSSAPGLIAVGCMNGSVAVLDSSTGAMLGSCKPHSKYVVAVAWSHCGQHLATASYDHSWTIQSVAVSGEGAAGCSRAAAPDAATTTATTSSSSGGAAAQSGDRVQFRMIRQVRTLPLLLHHAMVMQVPAGLCFAVAHSLFSSANLGEASSPAMCRVATSGGGHSTCTSCCACCAVVQVPGGGSVVCAPVCQCSSVGHRAALHGRVTQV